MSRRSLAIIGLIGGAALTGISIWALLRDRRRRQLGGAITGRASTAGLLRESVARNGRVTKVYAKKQIPIEKRIALIQGHIAEAVKDPEMRKLALAITGQGGRVTFGTRTLNIAGANCPARDGVCEARAIYDFKRAHLRYTGDIAPHKQMNGVVEPIDLFQSPQTTIEFGGDDCDGHAAVGASLALLNQLPANLVVGAPNRHPTDDDYEHIWEEAYVGGPIKKGPDEYVPIDTGNDQPNFFGKRAPHKSKLEFVA